MTIKSLEHTTLDDLHSRLLEEIPPGSSILDVGAGLAKYHELLLARGCVLTLLDAHKPYLDERTARFPGVECIHGDARTQLLPRALVSAVARRWDVAIGVDFIEHLELAEALQVLQLLCEVAPKVILFTPEGNHPQDKDAYNMGGDHWQTHRSIWSAEMFQTLSFEVERWPDFHRWAADRGCDPGAIWAVWRRQ